MIGGSLIAHYESLLSTLWISHPRSRHPCQPGAAPSLGQAAIVDWLTLALALIASVLLLRFKINSTRLVAGGAIAGILSQLLG